MCSCKYVFTYKNHVYFFDTTCLLYRAGFNLLADKRTCADVNECEDNPRICNGGHCNNTIGSFLCSCSGGLLKGADGSSCIGNHLRSITSDYLKKTIKYNIVIE